MTNRKSYLTMIFGLLPKSMTLNDAELRISVRVRVRVDESIDERGTFQF